MGPYGTLLIFLGFYGFLWVHYGSLMVVMGLCGSLWVLMGSFGSL